MAKVTRNCNYCNQPFQTTDYRLEHGWGKYCCNGCRYSAVRLAPRSTCLECGAKFQRGPSQIKNGAGKYCSKKCKNAARSRIVGEAHWSWKGGEKRKRFRSYLGGAVERNLEFKLTEDEFESFWQKPCHYCGGPIETVGLDRVDNGVGYLHNNLVSCCRKCNLMKMRLDVPEFLEHVRKIYEFNTTT